MARFAVIIIRQGEQIGYGLRPAIERYTGLLMTILTFGYRLTDDPYEHGGKSPERGFFYRLPLSLYRGRL